LKGLEPASEKLRIQLEMFPILRTEEFDSAFATIVAQHLDCFLIVPAVLFYSQRALLAELSLKYRLGGVSQQKDFVEAGGLISYGADTLDLYRRSASYVDRILKGEKPADLPVQQPTKYELVINLKTAKALGLEIPATLLTLADKVIE
jgi:putative tryptophan/tyrosine transport system substrate-binding protein